MRNHSLHLIGVTLFLGTLFVFGDKLHWGNLSLGQTPTITVSGTASSDLKSDIATYSAAVAVSNDNKDTAVNEVNTKMNNLITALKNFGIPAEDIKTEQVSVNENMRPEIMIYPPQPAPDQLNWTASNTITIKLKEANRAGGLNDLLNSSGATNVYGPNFDLDRENLDDSTVLTQAVEDARQKAEKVAAASGRKLGKVITITEGSSYSPPIYYAAMESKAVDMAVPSPIEPGTQTVSKSVTVIFELK